MSEYNDNELLALFRTPGKQEEAFRYLIGKYQQRLYWHIRKIVIVHEDADDILQNTFIKIWNSLTDFRNDSQLYTWIYRIATNEALTFLKQRKKYFFSPEKDVAEQLSESLQGDAYFDGDETQKKLQQAILLLPEKQRLVFNMKYFDEMKYEDMSKILHTSVGALKASYHHAVKKIEEFMQRTI